MTKRIIIVVSLAISAVFLLAACERSASQPVLATPTAENTLNTTPQPTGLSLMETWGTSTAVYEQTAVAMGLITPAPSSEAGLPTLTPASPETTLPPVGVGSETPNPGTTPLPAIVVATATPGRPATYTLQAGEFPYCIARRFDVAPADLLSLNNLVAGQDYPTGMTLSIPQTGSYPGVRALQPHPAQYTVNVGDTFYKIACVFGDVDPTAIAAANGLAVTAPLTTGQILNIP